jgi:hypothetical protein
MVEDSVAELLAGEAGGSGVEGAGSGIGFSSIASTSSSTPVCMITIGSSSIASTSSTRITSTKTKLILDLGGLMGGLSRKQVPHLFPRRNLRIIFQKV